MLTENRQSEREEEILHIFPDVMRPLFRKIAKQYNQLQEIRLRVNRPVIVVMGNQEFFLNMNGEADIRIQESFIISEHEITDILNHICNYSIYAFEDEIRQGFITIPGGHRVGIAGQVVLENEQAVRYIKNIRYMNIRIAHQVKGAANKVLPFLYHEEQFQSTLIISPPGCGKTTLLRDVIRQVSDGNKWGRARTVGVVDERSEIAGGYQGIPQNDIGLRTDVIEGCPKIVGMQMLLRAMAPAVMAIDELGNEQEVLLLKQVTHCGSGIIATLHGENMQDIYSKRYLKEAIDEGIFKRFIVMAKKEQNCVVQGIFDEGMRPCCEC